MQDPQSLVGEVLHETYRLERLIGEGGMGAVYEASLPAGDRRVALKLLAPDGDFRGVDVIERFWREAAVTSRIVHPHVVEYIDVNQTPQGRPYLVMELLEGEDLAQRLERVGRLRPAEAAPILAQAAAGLQAAHDQKIIHRDLKPSNIFICRRGPAGADHVKLVDFGISKVLSGNSELTGSHTILGTPFYLAPEQLLAAEEVSALTDVYALGVILYEMLCGAPPFADRNVLKLVNRIAQEAPPAPRALVEALPREVESLLLSALAKRQAERPSSALDLGRAYAAAIDVDVEAYLQVDAAVQSPTGADRKANRPWLLARTAQLRSGVEFEPAPGARPAERLGRTEPLWGGAGSEPSPSAASPVEQLGRTEPLWGGAGTEPSPSSSPTEQDAATSPDLAPQAQGAATSPDLAPQAQDAATSPDLASQEQDAATSPYLAPQAQDAATSPYLAPQAQDVRPRLSAVTTAREVSSAPREPTFVAVAPAPPQRWHRVSLLALLLVVGPLIGWGIWVGVRGNDAPAPPVVSASPPEPSTSHVPTTSSSPALAVDASSAADQPAPSPLRARVRPDAAPATTVRASAPPPTAPATSTTVRRLWITSRPAGARVLLHRTSLGQTPLRGVAIPRRGGVLMLRRRGHLERRVRIASGAGAVHLPPVTLKPLGQATLQVVARSGTRPISAEVYLDGKRLGETPLYKRKLAPGYHTVVARLEGYKVARRSIRLLAGRSASVVLELRKR